MRYIVKGNFCASLLLDIAEPVNEARVRIYQVEPTSQNDSENIHFDKGLRILTEKKITNKEGYLIGKGRTDNEGNYEIELSNSYREGPIVIDLKLATIQGQNAIRDRSLQFTVQRLQPVWRVENDVLHYCWNYCFSFELWSHLRTLFDAWTICGHVKSVHEDQNPIVGVTVSAFDYDWIKDDVLGSNITDAKGYFRIDFGSTDFKKTFLSPLINIDTPISSITGPSVYFKVTSADGALLYEEKRAQGRTGERKHVPRCYYVDLHIVA